MKKYFSYGILIFVCSITIGYVYSRMWNRANNDQVPNRSTIYENSTIIKEDVANENIVNENKVLETVSEEEKVMPNTKFAIKKYFSKCGHFKFNYTELPLEIINLKREEVEKVYSDWNVDEFSNKEIVISQKEDGLCDEHYVIKLDNGFVKIYNKTSEDTLNLYRETDISKDYLTEDDIQKLEIGMLVFGKGKLNSVLEDFE